MTQLALEFERPAGKAPKIRRCDVEKVIANLRGKGWQSSHGLGFESESDKRILRAIAEASEGQIISGQKGYKLTLEATPEDLNAAGWLKSQGDKMRHRWLQIQRVWHRRGEPHGRGAEAGSRP